MSPPSRRFAGTTAGLAPALAVEGLRRQSLYFGYWLIAASFAVQFVSVGVTNYAAGPFLTPMTEDLGWTRAEFTIPRSLGGLVMALAGFFIGTWVDRFGGRRSWSAASCSRRLRCALGRHRTLAEWVVLNGVLLSVGAALFGNLVVNVTLAKWFVALRGRAVRWRRWACPSPASA